MCSRDHAAPAAAPGPAPGPRRRAAVAGCGLLLLVAPAPPVSGQSEPGPAFWGVELLEPWRLGVGFDLVLASADDLETTALETVTLVCDAAGNCSPGVVPVDSALLNRKFGFEWEETVPGLQVPLGLPPLRLGRGRDLHSALVLEVGSSDLRLDFRDRTRSGDSTALEGRGARFGLGFEAAAPLCGGCPFFVAAGYRYRLLPDLEVDRRGEVAPGLQVLADRVVLEQEQHLVSARLGYAAGRFVPYLGLRARRSEIEIEDQFRFAGPSGSDTGLITRTALENEAIDGLAGLDVEIGARLRGRLETTFGGGGEGALLKLVYRFSPGGPPQVHPPPEQTRRAEEVRAAVAPDIPPIEAAFESGRAELRRVVGPAGAPAYLVADVIALLSRTEASLLAALEPHELAPLRAWVSARFARVRGELVGAAPSETRSTAVPRPALAAAPGRFGALRPLQAAQRAAPGERVAPAGDVERALDSVRGIIETVRRLFETGRLTVWPVCIVTEPKQARFTMVPVRYRQAPRRHQIHETDARLSNLVYRGLYAYEVVLDEHPTVDSEKLGFAALDFVDLRDTRDSNVTIWCRLAAPGQAERGCDVQLLQRDPCQEEDR